MSARRRLSRGWGPASRGAPINREYAPQAVGASPPADARRSIMHVSRDQWGYMGELCRSCQASLCGRRRLGLRQRRASHPRLPVGADVPLERDLDLVLLDRPPAHGREPPETAPPLRHDAPPAVDQGAPAGRRQLLVLLGFGPAKPQDLL